jgi:hypothetical protein
VRRGRGFRPPDRRQPRHHEWRIVFVPETEMNWITFICLFFFLSFSLENHFSRVGTGHVNLPSGHGAEESVGGATSPQALDQRGGRLTSPLKTRWTRVDGWVTTFFFSKRILSSYGSCVSVSAVAGLLKRIRIPKSPGNEIKHLIY